MLKPNLTAQEFGHWFESEFLSIVRKSKRGYIHPLVDTRSAGNIVNPQPSDQHMTIDGKSVYFECKTMTEHSDFSECYKSHIRPIQAAACRLIKRAGGEYFFPVLQREGELTFYEGEPVVLCYHRKSSKFPTPVLRSRWADRVDAISSFLNYIDNK